MWFRLSRCTMAKYDFKPCCVPFMRVNTTLTETLRITIFLAVPVNAGCMQAHRMGYWYIPWDGQMMAWQLSYASAPLMVLFAYICLLSAASESLDTYSISHRTTPVPVKPSWRIWTNLTISETQQNTTKCKQYAHGMNICILNHCPIDSPL